MKTTVFVCFAREFIKAGTPDAVAKLPNGLSDLTSALAPLDCPVIDELNPTTLDKLPGYKRASTAGFQNVKSYLTEAHFAIEKD